MVLTAPDSTCHRDSEGARSLLVTAMRRDAVTENLIDELCHEWWERCRCLPVIERSGKLFLGFLRTVTRSWCVPAGEAWGFQPWYSASSC